MKKYLKIKSDNDAQGCLQDIHWYSGIFGYFSCYALGAIIASQLMAKFKFEHKDYASQIKNGNFKTISSWLKDRIHKYSSFYLLDELVKHATGEKLNPDYFIKHLKNRYQM